MRGQGQSGFVFQCGEGRCAFTSFPPFPGDAFPLATDVNLDMAAILAMALRMTIKDFWIMRY